MIFVVVEELIPDSQTNGNTDVATLVSWLAFVIKDDPRRRFGITCHHLVKQMQGDFLYKHDKIRVMTT